RKSPYLIAPPWRCSTRNEKSGLLTMAEISGLMISATKALTIAVKAAPMTTATARSTTLPRRIKSRNPLSMGVLLIEGNVFGRPARRFYFSGGGVVRRSDQEWSYNAP